MQWPVKFIKPIQRGNSLCHINYELINATLRWKSKHTGLYPPLLAGIRFYLVALEMFWCMSQFGICIFFAGSSVCMPWQGEKLNFHISMCSVYNIQQFHISFEKSTSTIKWHQLRTCFNGNECPRKTGTWEPNWKNCSCSNLISCFFYSYLLKYYLCIERILHLL